MSKPHQPRRPRFGTDGSWSFLGGVITGMWTEVVPVSRKERVTLLVAARRRLSWFDAAAAEGLFAMLDPLVRAELFAWTSRGGQALTDIAQRVEAAPSEGRDELAVAAMDRYRRLTVEPPARITLLFNLASHFDAGGERGRARDHDVGSPVAL